ARRHLRSSPGARGEQGIRIQWTAGRGHAEGKGRLSAAGIPRGTDEAERVSRFHDASQPDLGFEALEVSIVVEASTGAYHPHDHAPQGVWSRAGHDPAGRSENLRAPRGEDVDALVMSSIVPRRP